MAPASQYTVPDAQGRQINAALQNLSDALPSSFIIRRLSQVFYTTLIQVFLFYFLLKYRTFNNLNSIFKLYFSTSIWDIFPEALWHDHTKVRKEVTIMSGVRQREERGRERERGREWEKERERGEREERESESVCSGHKVPTFYVANQGRDPVSQPGVVPE